MVQAEAGLLVESWSGYALQRAGKTVSPFVVPALNERGQLNVACDFGSLGFWFKPYWSSSVVKPGNEPGVPARLLDLVVVGAQDAAVGWSLQTSADGNAIYLLNGESPSPQPSPRSDGARENEVLSADIAWSAGEWHWVLLNYGEKGTALYVDEAWVAEGDATMALPPKLTGLVLGSSLIGDESAQGEFEDFYCYRKQMTALQPGFGYAGVKKHTLLGAISAEEVAALAKRRAERKALKEAQALLEEESGGGMMMRMMTTTVDCVTNSPLYITNTVCVFDTNTAWTVQFDVQGTNSLGGSSLVEIYTTTNLAGNNITNANWLFLESGTSCATYQYTNQFGSQSFYILGDGTIDPDGDGLSTAYERLVTRTNPNLWDTDGDGMSDGWEVNNGSDPTTGDADADGMLDQPFSVIIARPQTQSVTP